MLNLILWLISPILNYIACLEEDRAREFADGDWPHLPAELRTGQRIGCGLGDAAYRAAASPSDTHVRHASFLSGPLNGTGTL